jgi:hypothetical protein
MKLTTVPTVAVIASILASVFVTHGFVIGPCPGYSDNLW